MVRSAEEDLSLEPDILEESKKKGNGCAVFFIG